MRKAIICSSVIGAPVTRFLPPSDIWAVLPQLVWSALLMIFVFAGRPFVGPVCQLLYLTFWEARPFSYHTDWVPSDQALFAFPISSSRRLRLGDSSESTWWGADSSLAFWFCLFDFHVACLCCVFAGDQSCLEACGWWVGVVCDTDFVDISEDFFSIFLIPALFPIHHLLWLRWFRPVLFPHF